MDKNGWYHIYTDGCCFNNGGDGARAGIGVYFPDDEYLNVSEPLEGRPANNRAEITAIIRAADIAYDYDDMRDAIIHTDSQFAINCVHSWHDKWEQNNWRRPNGKPVVNKDEVIEMVQSLRALDSFKLKLVRAHSGVYGNEMADELAKQGALRARAY